MAKAGSRISRSDETLSDADLVRAWRKGDGLAAEILVRRHQKPVYRLMLRSTGDATAADDLTQKAFLKTLEKVERLRADEAFCSWLFRIALNLAKSRGRGIMRWLRAPGYELERVRSDAPMPDDEIDRQKRLERTRDEVSRLPKMQRQVVQMRVQAELPFKSIAEVLGTSEASAKVTYHNAVRRLRERLGDSK